MPLKDYRSSNSPEILPHLKGEKLAGGYFDKEGRLCLVTEDGIALRLGSQGGGAPVFWVSQAADVRQELDEMIAEANRAAALARALTDVARELTPAPTDDAAREQWIARVQKRSKVLTAEVLEKRDFDLDAQRQRRPAAAGILIGYKTGHGLCLQVEHADGMHGWYEPDELRVLP